MLDVPVQFVGVDFRSDELSFWVPYSYNLVFHSMKSYCNNENNMT